MTRTLPLLALLLSLTACSSGSEPLVPTGPLPTTSVYHLDTVWGTDADQTQTLADLRGHPVAIAMVYADCGTACPLIVNDMKTLGAEIDDPTLRYVLVTLDPERDTPEHLRGFRTMHALDDSWSMLRGTPDDVQTLAALLDVRYRAEPGGTIAHSNRITLLDANGDIVTRQDGLGTDPAAAATSFKSALALAL